MGLREPDAPHPSMEVPLNWDTFKGLWKNLDLNGDGEISEEEIRVGIQSGQISLHCIKSMDADGDGKITKAQLKLRRGKTGVLEAGKKSGAAPTPDSRS